MGSNYIAIDMNGQKVALKFGFEALRMVREKESKVPFYTEYPSLDNPGQTITVYSELAYAHIMYAGYINNQLMKNEGAVIPFESFCTLIEDLLLTPDKFVAFITISYKPVKVAWGL
jgi:5-formaminoimidazole-4-carboxamide-1-beta-D-ribofuranosyl 5'-monophosphate synthetase